MLTGQFFRHLLARARQAVTQAAPNKGTEAVVVEDLTNLFPESSDRIVEDIPSQSEIDSKNEAFWETLCGSWLAKSLGITDDSPESLEKFDQWYLGYYPYLQRHVPWQDFAGKKVLEIGLGYGTLSQKIMEQGADYTGMDIANAPVEMCRHRMKLLGTEGQAFQRNFLVNELGDESFDVIVAVGCFHHTGNVLKCISESHRLLRPGGTAHFMVYNRFSFRRLQHDRERVVQELIAQEFGRFEIGRADTIERGLYDGDLNNNAPPETVFMSKAELLEALKPFDRAEVSKENMDDGLELGPREEILETWGKRAGLDLYVTATK